MADPDFFNDLYPERRTALGKASTLEILTGRAHRGPLRDICYSNIISVMEYPLIKLMLSALKNSGCPVVPSRHFACDICKPGNNNFGNYDPETNQVFFCCNNSKSFGTLHAHIFRNLLVMYDVCTRKVDFNNLEHLACLEVRKANLGDCNYLVYFSSSFSKFRVKEQHKVCVRNVAVKGLEELWNIDKKTAEAVTQKVFSRCYNDLEPVGRRCVDKRDMTRAEQDVGSIVT